MSIHNVLESVELEYLRDTLRDNKTVLTDLSHISTLQEDGAGGIFEKSLRVKQLLDEYQSVAERQPSLQALAVLVRSEYRLWKMNEQTPLRHNPFLSHWVEAIQRLEQDLQTLSGQGSSRATESVSVGDVIATRLEMIKRILLRNVDVDSTTPRALYDDRYPGTPFDVQPYIRMLEEEGIYEAPANTVEAHPPPTSGKSDDHDKNPHHPTPALSPQQTPSALTFADWKSSILASMHSNPSLVTTQLTRLPLLLPALDFLTDLITTSTLSTHNIDPKPIVLHFTQHALRLVEHMGQPPDLDSHPIHSTSTQPPTSSSTTAGPSTTPIGFPSSPTTHGRAAQTRALRLLLLFLRNLVKKGWVDTDPGEEYTLYWDLEGLFTSYMWLGEVREFKRLIEEGEG